MSSMSERLKGKTILITGASSGIGKAAAIEFAKTATNLKLILTARRFDALEQLAEHIKGICPTTKIHPLGLDMTDSKKIATFIGELPADFKDIDVLVNNAGLVKGKETVGQLAEEDVDVMLSTNVTGLINMTQAVLKVYFARGGHGDIINIGSIAGRDPYPGGSIYCGTKAFVRTFTESMRKELISTRIRVSCVDPGQVETEFSIVRFRGDKNRADQEYAGVTPLTGEDIAEAIVFVAGRKENTVIADMLIFPNHQAGAGALYRKPI